MESEDDLAARLTGRLPIEEAEECLCQLAERCITVRVLGEADAQDLADELGFSARWCDAVLLEDEAWRASYGEERLPAPGVHANAHVAVQAVPHSVPDKAPGALSGNAIKTEHEGFGGAGPLTQVCGLAARRTQKVLLLTASMVLARSLPLSLSHTHTHTHNT